MWRTERGCLHWLCKSVIFKQNMLFHLLTFLTTSFSWNILVSTSITASPLTQKKVHTRWCFELLFLLIFLLDLTGERIWHHFTVGPVAHYHAAPHQENYTGRREWSPLIFLLELLTVLHPTFFCLEPLTSILAANLSLWLLALDFLHRYCVSFTPSVLLFSCLFKSTFELLALKRLVPIDMNTKFPLFTVV